MKGMEEKWRGGLKRKHKGGVVLILFLGSLLACDHVFKTDDFCCCHVVPVFIYIFKCFYMFYSFLLIHHVYIFITLWWAEVLVRRTLERWGLHDVPMFYLFICFPLQVWTLSLLFWHGWSGLSSGFCFWWIIDLKSLCCILIYTAH